MRASLYAFRLLGLREQRLVAEPARLPDELRR
jgi:hypothetical protein